LPGVDQLYKDGELDHDFKTISQGKGLTQTMTRGHQCFVVKRTNTGLGIFATESIPAGKRLAEYVGRILPNDIVEKLRGKYFFGINSKWAIDGSGRNNIARYFNHSCSPNAEAFVSGKRVWIWSKTNIKPGQEITFNYGKEYFDEIIKPQGCKCDNCKAEQKKQQPLNT